MYKMFKIFKKTSLSNPPTMQYRYNPGDKIYGCLDVYLNSTGAIEAHIVPFTIEKVLINHGTVKYIPKKEFAQSLMTYQVEIPEIMTHHDIDTLKQKILASIVCREVA